jgi:hypothetical protein
MIVQGYIYGDNNVSIKANVLLFDPVSKTSQVIEILPGEQYTIDGTEVDIADMLVTFSAVGYVDMVVTVGELFSSGSNIHLERAASSSLLPIVVFSAAAIALMNKKKKSVSGTTANDLMPVILVGGVLFGVHMISRILDKLGLGGDPTTGEQSDPNSPFNPTYWRGFSSFTYAITLQQADTYAETIHNAFTVFQDDFNAIWSVFSQLKTKANVSFLSDIFSRKYTEALLPFLTDGGGLLPWDGLSKDNLNKILSYVSQLPTN